MLRKSILFVDDETSVLLALSRMPRCMDDDWDMTFVEKCDMDDRIERWRELVRASQTVTGIMTTG
jgi:hypothetical protein